jgi:disulfide bond formation protein DsbB
MSAARLFSRLATPRAAALLLLGASLATIAGAWIFESLGYLPCELCLKERIPFYAGAPVAALAALLAYYRRERPARAALFVLALLFFGGAALAAYHSGVEWKIFAGPDDCSGPMLGPSTAEEFMRQLQKIKVVRCDAPALLVFGLSLANWNVLISLALSSLSGAAAARRHITP